MVPTPQMAAQIQAEGRIRALRDQPPGSLSGIAKIFEGSRQGGVVYTHDGTSPGNSSGYGITDDV